MYRNYLCRVCACTETTSVLVNIFEKHGAQDSVADILLELADIKVTVDDGFPQQCCLRCHTEVVQAVSLRRKCMESEKLFRIKIEPDSCIRSTIAESVPWISSIQMHCRNTTNQSMLM
ncbi:uncharacterized protein LOC121598061 isoform X5 [Anopheles merus]|uniref:uncharacterized protein LOC121598061 isoform X5 n=1 Tax=Anopheles merus TaxID=30066 RepID=UPI001BE3E2F8|nr:uncharacterized protein LOC121598061 isoform X5 [Anopheles merus]